MFEEIIKFKFRINIEEEADLREKHLSKKKRKLFEVLKETQLLLTHLMQNK